jgi:RNase P subunit RPR2
MSQEIIAQHGRLVYCKGCGQLAGVATTCPVYRYEEHSFVSSTVPVVCKGCGALPGKASQCPVYRYGEHDFVPIE